MNAKRVFAIVPVKPLDEGKSRLATIMSPDVRRRLNAFLMNRTFDLVTKFPGAPQVIVVSSGEDVKAEAHARGMITVQEDGRDLNTALASATRTAIEHGAEAVFVLPVDLPLATSADLERIAEYDDGKPLCVVVSDRHRSGTNLLYVSPPRDDLYRFGPGSFRRHCLAASERNFRVLQVDEEALSLDIDDPADFERWGAAGGSFPE